MTSQNVKIFISWILSLALFSACTGREDIMGRALMASLNKDAAENIGQPDDSNTDPSPTPSSSPPSSSSNALVFEKNPVHVANQSGIGYSYNGSSVTPSTQIDLDPYLKMKVAIAGTTNGLLENKDIIVKPNSSGSKQRAQADSTGQWIFSSKGDSNFRLGQLMAFFWIRTQRDHANSLLKNAWHAAGKEVNVYSYCKSMFNAYWANSLNQVCMGYVGHFESAFDASVYTHEMGHANIDYGTNKQITSNMNDKKCSSNSDATCCPSADGCSGAINEGQADVHSFILFNSGRLGEFFLNNINGLSGRNAEYNTTTSILTAQARFASDPEIHGMGAVWSAAWWSLRKSIPPTNADKLFFSHLEMLQGSDTFKTALQAVLTTGKTLKTNGTLPSNYDSEIRQAFSRHGITP